MATDLNNTSYWNLIDMRKEVRCHLPQAGIYTVNRFWPLGIDLF